MQLQSHTLKTVSLILVIETYSARVAYWFSADFMARYESVSDSLISSVVRVMLKVAFRFEPLAPTAISLLLHEQLHRYRDGGIISDYKTHTKRLGRYHYRIEVDLDVTDTQALHLLANVFPKQFSGYGRWFHD